MYMYLCTNKHPTRVSLLPLALTTSVVATVGTPSRQSVTDKS